MEPAHTTLSPLLELPQLINRRIAFISEKTVDRSSWHQWFPSQHGRQILYQTIQCCDMAVEVVKARDAEVFFIFEHKAQYALPLYITLLWKRKPVLFIVHGLQQTCWRSTWHMWGLKMLRCLVRHRRFYPVYLEKDDQLLDDDVRFPSGCSLQIPHPHPLASQKIDWPADKWRKTKFRIGVIGILRKDKPTRKLIETLVKIRESSPEDFDLVLGTPFWQKAEWVDKLGIEVVDTGTESAYMETLGQLHICVFDFNKPDFYFRPSGVILDAGMNGCFVLCPRFPVFEAQITTPVTIGKTFSSYEELPELIHSSIRELRENGEPDFARWREYRNVHSIAKRINDFLEEKALQ
jgi:hypothetical protein